MAARFGQWGDFTRTIRLRSARNRSVWRGLCNELGKPPEVLCDGCQRELEGSAGGAAQTQSTKTQDALEVGEQHLDFFAVTARLSVGFGFAACPGDIARLFVDAAQNLSRRLSGRRQAYLLSAFLTEFRDTVTPVSTCTRTPPANPVLGANLPAHSRRSSPPRDHWIRATVVE
jgi:hypothetical protein